MKPHALSWHVRYFIVNLMSHNLHAFVVETSTLRLVHFVAELLARRVSFQLKLLVPHH